ncbi:MAG TPA: bifunctional [glutamine synthetase] adenylyltransferase/[glutamine synthetase]-adenylyl-L-tyrosine phosphorylase [Pilimelia sp.]|nr:bifunctional [glutamine synthetase] adenylyltransferase/[glutamine synthetase]-adenylyl-L-tyrosine phosphorylase [Pilimelia sp.]
MTRTTARLTRYGFAPAGDGPRTPADALLGPDGLGWWDAGRQAPTDAAAEALLTALGAVADPDQALRQLHRVVAAARAAGLDPPPLADTRLRDRLFAVLGASSALGDHLVAHPADVAALDGAPAALGTPTTVPALRRAYRRALLGVAADDLTGARDLESTMAALSTLADLTLRAGYAIAEAEVGPPAPRLAVVAMGKCGGGELNYVSDVDVVFVADSDADLSAGTRLAARLMAVCQAVAWPVDAALRPEGARGPLVRTLSSYLAYYARWARTWEFQALLKARPAAGDTDLAARWQAAVAPLVWRAAERPEAVADVRAMRRRILDHVPAAEVDREVKRGPGGLRDIEFAVQLLQLVHGRGDEALRAAGTIPALRALVAGGYVARADGEALLRGYEFLRRVEHRLQLQHLRRTHTVPAPTGPDGAAALRRLARALGYRAGPGRDAAEAFHADWRAHAADVRRLHAKLLYRPLLAAVARVPAAQLRLTPEAAGRRLELLGYADPAGALRHIQALTGGVSRRAAIQRTLLPVLLQEFADAPEPDRGLLAYRQVSDALGATSWYLRLLRDGGPVAQRLARVLGLARYAADLLARDPEALRMLADDAALCPRGAAALRDSFTATAARHLAGPGGDPAAAVRAVRALRRRELLRIACADLLSHAGPLAPAQPVDGDAVGAALSDVADATLAAALDVARRCAGATAGLRLAVIGMGRLGGRELSYPSDADVLFVYDAAAGVPDAADTAHAVARRLRELLALPAPDPPLGVDADLRPEGRQGPLARSLGSYAAYYARWSKVWEAQALLRARPVAGDADLGAEFVRLADSVRYPDGGLAPEQVVEIRRIKARVDTERLPRGADPSTHTKLGRGGLADVEWAVQILQLCHGHRHPGLRTPGTVAALVAARAAGLVDSAAAAALAAGWRQATAVRNALTLVRGKATDQLPRHGADLAGVVAVLGGDDPGALLDGYLRTARHAHAAVERIMNG